MKIFGMLSWYDENPNWLAACVAAMSKICDHIVAADGAYLLFPGSLTKPRSAFDQLDAITRTCEATGTGLTLYQQKEPWWGGEVEKRDAMLHLAPMSNSDWIFICDADELVSGTEWARKALEETEYDAAEIMLWEQIGGMEQSQHPLRRFFRALDGLHFEDAHYVLIGYRDGREVVVSGADTMEKCPALILHDVKLEDRNRWRNPIRAAKSLDYYARRDEQQIEALSDPYRGKEMEHAAE